MTYEIIITGVVQGVGFRPFVYKLAHELGLRGSVQNDGNGVHVLLNAEENLLGTFVQMIERRKPQRAVIDTLKVRNIDDHLFEGFCIIASSSSEAYPDISPDFGICKQCVSEMMDVTNRRYRYPYITCTDCGPRAAIITAMPYDREQTTMERFEMCPTCQTEYEDANDRRFHAQSLSCPNCGIIMSLRDQSLQPIACDDVVTTTVNYLRAGKIVAVKGLSGYLLLCDTGQSEIIQQLRKRKHRPQKPLALLMKDIEMAERYVSVSNIEKQALQSAIRPIVMCNMKNTEQLALEDIAPQLNTLGVMLPSSGLLYLIADDFGKSLVATSANLSGQPLIYKDDDEALGMLADIVLSDNRPIVNPQDDSLIRFSPKYGKRIILRRSRGFSPSIHGGKGSYIGLGSDLKGTFTICNGGKNIVSQHIGNLTDYTVQERYLERMKYYNELTKSNPSIYIKDKHPNYQINTLVDYKSERVQHHEAHFAAILSEHRLEEEKVLGVIWDGVGYGSDDNLWGGEFFKYKDGDIYRIGHIDYYQNIAGDKMAKEPRLSALSLCHKAGHSECVKDKFTKQEWNFYLKSLESSSGTQTSSLGRIFDAVAALLGLVDKNSYEGHAAILLEQEALAYWRKPNKNISTPYNVSTFDDAYPIEELIGQITHDVTSGIEKSVIALKFHQALAEIIRRKAEKEQIQSIAFSGGVFQNALLVDCIVEKLGESHQLYFHERLSPNDENISYGQVMYMSIKEHFKQKKQTLCV